MQAADDFFQLPNFGNDRGVNMYQLSHPTGNLHSRWPKRNSGDATGGNTVPQNFHLMGQTPQSLAGHETNHNYSYATGSFPTNKHGGGFHTNRLQNAINYNRNRYFQYQFPNEISESTSNRMLQGIQGGHFNGMDPQQQYSVNKIYMNGGGRRMPQTFKPSFNHISQGDAFGPSSQYSFDSMLPNIPGHSTGHPDRSRDFDIDDDLDEEEGNYRYKYNARSARGSDAADLIGKYAKYYRTQTFQGERNKHAPPSNDKNNELVSRYLKHSAKKQVRSTSISVPKYTGDYDPDVYVTGRLESRETLSQSSFIKDSAYTKQPSQEEIIKGSILNKQEAAAEQKFRLEKSNFPAPTSLNNASTETKSEKAKYKLKYTKRKKMVIASTRDKENDPSMLVKGGDDVALGNDSDDDDDDDALQNEEAEVTEPTPVTQEKTVDQQAPTDYKIPTAKKIIKKIRRPSVVPKSVPENEKKTEASNKQQSEQTNKSKVTKNVDIRKQVKRVSIEKVKRSPLASTKNEEQNKEEETEENNLQSIAEEEEEIPHLEDSINHSGDSEKELQSDDDDDDDDDDDAEKTEQQNADDELNAILAPLRAQVPDHFRISPTLGFLPIMPVTFSWFPMSQQHKEAFQKMSEQSKFPNSLRPFQRFAAT